jgi:transcription initiation factor TFIID TATA-box-binding protein
MAGADSLSIENVVASTGIGQELDLESVSLDLMGADYDPEQFPGLVYRTQDPKAAALIFRSGKIVCTGASSVEDVHASLDIVFDELEALDIEIPANPEIIVQNIVSSGDLGTSLNLNAIAIGLGLEHVEYEPEQFPGLVYRLDDHDVVLLLFGSGKVVVTGATEVEQAREALAAVREELEGLGLLE